MAWRFIFKTHEAFQPNVPAQSGWSVRANYGIMMFSELLLLHCGFNGSLWVMRGPFRANTIIRDRICKICTKCAVSPNCCQKSSSASSSLFLQELSGLVLTGALPHSWRGHDDVKGIRSKDRWSLKNRWLPVNLLFPQMYSTRGPHVCLDTCNGRQIDKTCTHTYTHTQANETDSF